METARLQHASYAAALWRAGAQVEILEVNQTSPDAVFVEDTAIILDELAVISSMGVASRRAELSAMAEILIGFRQEVRHILPPATIEGGDVLRIGRKLFVGNSVRTNGAGISALQSIVGAFGYEVIPVKVHGCLHLKTCITALDDETFIRNSNWFDSSPFETFRLIEVAPGEAWAANMLRVGDQLIANAAFPRTADLLDELGFNNERVNISEFVKAEAGLTCMSLVFENQPESA